MARTPTVAFLIIGNEILSGRTRDANLPVLAEALNQAGGRLAEVRIIPDEPPVIIATLRALMEAHDHVVTSGGIGPTHDDMTTDAVAAALDLSVIVEPEAARRLRAYYPPEKLNDARMRMARVPQGATLIDNPVSAAPGYSIRNVHVMAGVPSVFRAMVAQVAPILGGGPPTVSRTVSGFAPEGDLAAALETIQAPHATITVGSYPFLRDGRVGTAVVVRGSADEAEALDQAVAAVHEAFKALGVDATEPAS